MIRAYTFSEGKVRFRTRFVAIEKYPREARANRFRGDYFHDFLWTGRHVAQNR
jgi:carotenoid cleavage dioxygenase-like enzyme